MAKGNKNNTRTPPGFKWVDNGSGGERLEDQRSRREKLVDTARLTRAADREVAKEAGTLQRNNGCGIQGGTDEQKTRRSRRSWKEKLRRGDGDE